MNPGSRLPGENAAGITGVMVPGLVVRGSRYAKPFAAAQAGIGEP
jgi:hypothetical protein